MKENFDDIIRRRWEERNFPLDEADRQAMARLLEGDKKRRGFFFWWLGALVVSGLIAFGIWTAGANHVKADPEAKAKEKVAESDIATLQKDPPQSVLHDEGESSATSDNPNKTALSENQIITKKNNQRSISKKAAKSTTTIHQSKNGNRMDPANAELKKENKADAFASAPEFAPAAENKIPENGFRVELEQPNQASILSQQAAITVFPDSIEYDPWTNAIYHNGTVRSLNKTKPLEPLDISEVENMAKPSPGNIEPHTKMTHPVYFLLETGLGLVLASPPYYDGGIKFNVGGGFGMRVMPRLHLQLTGGYLMQDGGFHFERTSTVNTLSFGLRSQFNSLQPDRLHFIYGKIGAAYRFQRSTLDAHLGVQWLYGSQGNITVQQKNQVPPGYTEESTYAWLNTDGLRKTLWWSDVSYGYMILPKLYVHGGVSFYFSSLTQSDPGLKEEGYYWNGKTAQVQPFVTLNYLLHANF